MGKVRTLRDPVPLVRARGMRANDTRAEAVLWQALRAHRLGGWKWRRQVPKGPFIVDFVCDEGGVAVEVDGGQHAEQVAYDARRTAFLAGCGLRVLRFWNHEVLTNRNGVCLTILAALGGDRPGRTATNSGGTNEAAGRPAPPLS